MLQTVCPGAIAFSNKNSFIYYLKVPMNGNSKRLPLAVDVGCGPGVQSTDQIAPYFDKVFGVDISQAQIDEAKKYHHPSNVEFW